jgi:hypothetical protein
MLMHCTVTESVRCAHCQKQSACQLTNLLLVQTSEVSRLRTCVLHHPAWL